MDYQHVLSMMVSTMVLHISVNLRLATTMLRHMHF